VVADAMGEAPLPPSAAEGAPAGHEAEKRARIASAVGEDVTALVRSEAIAAATRDGVIVRIELKRARFHTSNIASDLGLDDEVAAAVFTSLGRRRLIPKSLDGPLGSIETLVRRALKENSFKTPWGSFVPTGSWSAFKERFVELKAQYEEATEKIATALEDGTVQAWVQDRYAAFAREIWPKRAETWGDGAHASAEFPPEEFTAQVVLSALSLLPPPDDVTHRMVFCYHLNFISAPDIEYAINVAQGDGDLNRELVQHTNDERQRLVTDFLIAARSGLEAQFNNLIGDLEGRLSSGKTPGARTLECILKAVARLNDLNVTNDQVLRAQMDDLSAFINEMKEAPKDERGDGTAVLARFRGAAAQITASVAEVRSAASDFARVGQ